MRTITFLALAFALTACAGEPLDLNRVEFPDPAVAEEMTTLTPDSTVWLSSHEELTLRFSYRLDKGAAGRLLIDGKYPLELRTMALAGAAPAAPVAVSDDIFNDLEIQYVPASDADPAIVPAVYLNGNAVYYQQALPPVGAADGPLRVVTDGGRVEFTDLAYAPVAGRSSEVGDDGFVKLNVPLLRYAYFHLQEGARDFAGWESQPPEKTGYINRVDLNNIRDRSQNYAVRFTGTLNVPAEEAYYFFTWGPGKTDFFIDGKPVGGHAGAPEDWQTPDSLRLTAGDHAIDLRIVQHHGWNVNRISYRKAGSDEPLRFLNAMEEGLPIATPASPDPRELKTDDEPYLLRSFLYFPAPRIYDAAEKRTHVISVGEGTGPHYSLDLQTGALLQVWRGRFADVNDMWSGRGEPQVMRPLGAAVQFDGAPLTGPSADEPWPAHPDFPADDGFLHLSHELDEAGRPTFSYDAGQGMITDKLVPDGTGLLREITHSAGGNTSQPVQVVAARNITETAPGEYVLRGPGMKVRIDSYDGHGLTLQRSGGLDRLIAELPAKGHIRYRMDW